MPHDAYLKFWSGSQLKGARVLVDEAQDLNPQMVRPLKEAAEIVAAGDPHQQIYAWRRAVNALSLLRGLGEVQEHRLDGSYRFGPGIAPVNEDFPVREVKEAAEVDPELKPTVRLLEEKGAKWILGVYRRIRGKREGPSVVLSTVHRAKGLEWDHVVLGDDFPKGDKGSTGEELRLRYVAATRAKKVLDVGGWHGKGLAIAG